MNKEVICQGLESKEIFNKTNGGENEWQKN